MTVDRWFAQPGRPRGTAILLPGRRGGTDTPLLHWSATLLTQGGWSVLGVTWDRDSLERLDASAVRRCADAALLQARAQGPVLVVAKSLGTLALPWAVENGLPGVWLTPLLTDATVSAAVSQAQQPTLLVGGTADSLWCPPAVVGPGVRVLEVAGADHGLQQAGSWRDSLLGQVAIFDQIGRLAAEAQVAR